MLANLYFFADKCVDEMWPKLLMNETEIDRQKLDCSTLYTNLPEDVKHEVERVKKEHDSKVENSSEKEKVQFSPISVDSARDELLKKAWNVEGSPFQGTAFDPSKVSFMN